MNQKWIEVSEKVEQLAAEYGMQQVVEAVVAHLDYMLQEGVYFSKEDAEKMKLQLSQALQISKELNIK